MKFMPIRSLLTAALLGSTLFIANCGGTNSGENDGKTTTPRDTNNDSVAEGVSGPLDALQTPLNDQILNQLSTVAGGTPLAGTIDCIGQAVVIDLIDVADAIAIALQAVAQGDDPAAAFEAAAGDIQFSLGELANDLPGALTAVTGEDCNTTTPGADFAAGGNPLEGTPLAPLGASLGPVLEQLAGTPGEDRDLQSLSELVHQLSTAFAGGAAQLPEEVQSAPILGGLLNTLTTALDDLDSTLTPLALYNGEAAADELETTLNHLLTNVLTEIVPINFIEEQAGQQGAISGPIQDAVDQVTAALADNLLDAALPPLAEALDGPLAALLDPIENQLLPAILDPISEALMGSTVDGPTGTSLDLLLAQVTNALAGGTSGTPLDAILGPLLDSLSTSGECPLATTPLAPICDLLG